MCGRFPLIDIEDIRERFKTEPIDLKPNYNVAPSQDVPVIINDGGQSCIYVQMGPNTILGKRPFDRQQNDQRQGRNRRQKT